MQGYWVRECILCFLLLLATFVVGSEIAVYGDGERVTGEGDGDSDGTAWITNAANKPLGEDIVTTVVSVNCQNAPWSSPIAGEMEAFAAGYVTDQTVDFKLHSGPIISLTPANDLTNEMKWTSRGFTNTKGTAWSKWRLRCPATDTRPCKLPAHSHAIAFVYTFKYTDTVTVSSASFERVIVVVEGEPLEITHWQRNVPTNVGCHRDLSKITRRTQSGRNKIFFHAKNVCGGRVDVLNSAVWSPAACPNQGIYLLGWTATNEFQIYSTKHSTISVYDSTYPTISDKETRTICIVDEKHQANTPSAPKLCPARLVDYYARTALARDNCDDWDELEILVDSRERVICDGKGGNDGDGTVAKKSGTEGDISTPTDPTSTSKCRKVEETLDEILGSTYKREAPYNPYYERCTALPDVSITRYMLRIGDMCGNWHPTLVDITVHYVGSRSVCPAGSFAVDTTAEHLKDDGY